jgi:VIT1/CCC1 family predicted Fe2+/Mn2+ transporter
MVRARDTDPDRQPMSRRLLDSINAGSLAVAVGFGFTAALLFSPFFITPFAVLLGRSLFLAMVLLLVFATARALPDRWLPARLPRWLLTVLAVGLTAWPSTSTSRPSWTPIVFRRWRC